MGLLLAQLRSYNDILRRLGRRDPDTLRVVSDLDFSVSWLNRKKLWYVPYLVHIGIWLGLGLIVDDWLLGFAYFAGMMSHPIQGWMVNAFAHAYGYQNFSTGDDSRNNTLVAWLVMGEGFQNNHHRYPTSPRFSVRWFEVDLGYGLCVALQALGLLKIVGKRAQMTPRLETAATN
jgi:stearoyl-CoA desaturase (delta-9 desaturase)